jgi:hypothetical protein
VVWWRNKSRTGWLFSSRASFARWENPPAGRGERILRLRLATLPLGRLGFSASAESSNYKYRWRCYLTEPAILSTFRTCNATALVNPEAGHDLERG